MKIISFIIQLQPKGSKFWADAPFAGLDEQSGLEKLKVIRPSDPNVTFRLVRRVTVITDKVVKEPKPKAMARR